MKVSALIPPVLVSILLAGTALAGGLPNRAAKVPHHKAWMTSKDAAFKLARKEHKLVVVDAFAAWCGWCKRLDRDVLDLQRFVDHSREGFVLLRLDTEDRDQGTAFARKHRISNLPTTVIFDGDETVVGRIVGYRTYDAFVTELDNHAKLFIELQDRELAARDSGDPEELLTLSQLWKARNVPQKAFELASLAADSKTKTPEQEARAAYDAAASALALGKTDEAERRLNQLEAVQPFPELMDGYPELVRSDIASLRGDLDTAIEILEQLLSRGSTNSQLQSGLPIRIKQLSDNRALRQRAAQLTPATEKQAR